MAKRNRSRLKKRRKRYLQKRINATIKAVPAVLEVPKVKEMPPIPPPLTKLHRGKYIGDNEDYQKALDAVYHGKVKRYGRYFNLNATLVHYCSGCNKRFYARPKWMLGDEYPHDCSGRRGSSKQTISKTSKGLGFTWEQFYQMVWDDYTYSQIAKKLRINPEIVKHYFETEGLI